MPLNGSFEDLLEEWNALKANKQRDLDKIFSLCRPFLDQWEREFATQHSYPNCQMQFLLMRLEIHDEPRPMIQHWIDTIENAGSSLEEELRFLLIDFVRRDYWTLKMGWVNPRCVAQVFAVLFRQKLQNLIVQTWNKVDYLQVVDIEEYTDPWEDPEIDHILIRSLGITAWDSYILEMYRRGYNREQMMSYSHYPQHVIRREVTDIWNQLNTI